MRLALILPAETPHPGGVQRFGDAIAGAMVEQADVETFRVHPDAGGARTPASRLAALGRGWADLARRHRERSFDAVLTTFHWPWRLLPGVPMAGYVHDLRGFGLAGDVAGYGAGKAIAALGLRATFRTWDRVLVPSAHVAADVRRLDERLDVRVVQEGLDHLDGFRSAEPPPRDTIVAIGGSAPHKRAALAAEVAARAAALVGCDAVILGASPVVPQGVRVISGFDDAELAGWLERARVVLAASSYEGFGLAVGEAMRFGAPVVHASDCPIHDLVGDAGVAAAPDVGSMVEAVTRLSAEIDVYSARAFEGAHELTWARTARRVLEVLGEGRR